ncbi:MAG: LytTR family transcriptional regulator DNA-binding domain-containing protein [Prevotellaceae bacterium]|jgi:hypothetical protein|nr:LytTR family transcriptional regulator DNA-binding domain-containing protein [Prevotellaceae bacterium]
MFTFENNIKIILYVFLWAVYTMAHILSMYFLVNVPLWALITDAVIHSTIFTGLGILLWITLRYGKYETLTIIQKFVNYSALAFLIVILWVGAGCFFIYALLDDMIYAFLPALPVKVMIGTMLYMIYVLAFYVVKAEKEKDIMNVLPEIDENVEERSQNAESGSENAENRTKQSPPPETELPKIEQSPPPDTEQPETEQSPTELPEAEKSEEAEESEESEIETTESGTEIFERIVVKIRQKIHVIPIHDIMYLQSEGDYVQIVTEKGKYLKEQTMKYFEIHLPKSLFVRIHRSFIINIEYISRIESYGKQSQQISLKNGQWLKVSTSGYKALKTMLNL